MDLEIAKKEFLNYVSKYDATNFHIKGKIDHSIRVMAISVQIAESLKLSKEDIDLATLIGLLHDIGRFEQRRIYNTFNDHESIDHGDYGVEILKKDDYLRKYIKEEAYDDIIFTAIKNHNKLQIEEGLDDRKILFCKIIRDADKIDIIYQSNFIAWGGYEDKIENAIITKDIVKPLLEHRMINRKTELKKIEYPLNCFIGNFGFIFDINYKESFKIFKEKDYYNKEIDRFNYKHSVTKETIEEIRKIINSYIDSKQEGDSK